MAYQGKVVYRDSERLILYPWRQVRLGLEGISDLIGWTRVNLTDYGAPSAELAVFTAIECKVGSRRPTPAQAAFLELVARSGGRSGIARSVEDARAILTG